MSISQPLLKVGGFSTLSSALDYAALGRTGMQFFANSGLSAINCSYKELREHALRIASELNSYRLPRLSRVALLAQTCQEFVATFFACQYLGLIPCPMPFTVFAAGKEAYQNKLKMLLQSAQAQLLVVPANFLPITVELGRELKLAVCLYEELFQNAQNGSLLEDFSQAFQADDDAYIQFSSGSTSAPKGVLISQKAVAANIEAILRWGMQVSAEDRAFSWLPFYHDMGLVGFMLAPVCGQVCIDYLSPSGFARRPALWLELMSRQGCTITYAPEFAYALAALRLHEPASLNLSKLRIAGIGGDMIHAATLNEFAQKLAPSGFRFEAFAPSFGLAEATLAVSIKRPGKPPLIKLYPESGHTQALVASGELLPGYEVYIKSAEGNSLSDSSVGEVWVKGPSIITKYLENSTSIEVDSKGFIPTGDLGFVDQDQLFITGRSKDLIIVRGRNIWAQDVEWVVAKCDTSLLQQDIVALGVDIENEEHVVILIQKTILDAQARETLGNRILQKVRETFGVAAKLHWVAPHQLTLTSSGKLSRSEIKKRYQQNILAIID